MLHAFHSFDDQFDLSLFRLDQHRLLAHPSDHVKGCLGFAAQGELPHVLRDPFFHGRPHLLLDLEEPVRRTQPFDPLVRPLVVVILHPVPDPLHRALEGVEPRPLQELLPDRLPEPFDFPQGLRMVRGATDVLHPVPGQSHLEARLAAPRHVLPSVVGEHLLRNPVLANRPAVNLQQVFRRLPAEDPQPGDVAGVVVDEPDQVGILPGPRQDEREDVALPELVRCGTLEEPRLRRILLRLVLRRRDQLCLVQCLANRLRTRRQMQHPPQRLRDPLDPESGMFLLQPGDLGADECTGTGWTTRCRALHFPAAVRLGPQPVLAVLPVLPRPIENGPLPNPNFPRHQIRGHAFFQIQLNCFALGFVTLRKSRLPTIRNISSRRAAHPSPPRGALPLQLPLLPNLLCCLHR